MRFSAFLPMNHTNVSRSLSLLLILLSLMFSGCGKERPPIIDELLPAIPDLEMWPAELEQRIESASIESLEGEDPIQAVAKLSRLYHANGYLKEATACYNILMELDPNNARWPHLLATIKAGYGMLDEAVPLWETTTKLDPEYTPAFIRLGDVYLKMNEVDKAEEVYSTALKKDGRNAYACLGMARVAIAREDYPEARKFLEKGVNYSNFRIGTDLLASVYKQLGLQDKANYLLRTKNIGAFTDIPDPWHWDLLHDCYDTYRLATAGGNAAHAGDHAVGLRLLERAANMDAQDPMLQYQLGALALRTGDLDKAEKYLKRCVKLKADFSDGWFQLIKLYEARKDKRNALITLESGLVNCPESPALLLMKGLTYQEKGDDQRALQYLKRSAELRPNEALAFNYIAHIYFSKNDTENGRIYMEKALIAEPGNTMALSTLTFLAILEKDKERADELFTRIRFQARVDPAELKQLADKYKAIFGSLPPE